MSPKRCSILAATLVVVALAAACGGSSGESSSSSKSKAAEEAAAAGVNLLEAPARAKPILDEMVGPQTPISRIVITSSGVTVQELGRDGAFVRWEKVADPAKLPGATVPTTTEPGQKKKFGAPAAAPVQQYMGRTVTAADLTPDQLAALQKDIAKVEQRKAGAVAPPTTTPQAGARPEPYAFGQGRVDSWFFDSAHALYNRTPMLLTAEEQAKLTGRQFTTAEVDLASILPLEKQLLSQVDLGDHARIEGVAVQRGDKGGLTVAVDGAGDRAKGTLVSDNGVVSVHMS